MNLKQIGNFISTCRKKQNLTQEQLAEKLNITAKAISKWETGKGLPDASIMKELCNILNISVNELLSGELIDKKDCDKVANDILLDMVKQKEKYDRKLLCIEILIGIISILPFFISILIVNFFSIDEKLAVIIIITSLIPLLIATPFALKIEQTAGYYECGKCHNKYIPTYKSVFDAMHLGRTRYMKCPKCNKYSWNKKVLSKGDQND